MEIINNFEIENEIFYFNDINKLYINYPKLEKLPKVLKILLELNLRNSEDEKEFDRIVNIFLYRNYEEISFYPSRIIMENYDALFYLLELASIRDNFKLEEDIKKINPRVMIDILINNFSNEKDYEISKEKYQFIKWAENAFKNIRIIPRNSNIEEEINLDYLSTFLHIEKKNEKYFLFPESILCLNSSENIINTFGTISLYSNQIRAKESTFGKEFIIKLPKVIGVKIFGDLKEGIKIKNINIALKNSFKNMEFDGKILEFYGNGLKYISIDDRKEILKTIYTYGIKSAFFAIDNETIDYINKIKENEDYGRLIKAYTEKQGLFYKKNEQIDFDEYIEINLENLENLENSIFDYNAVLDNFDNSLNKEIFKGDSFWQNLEFEKSYTYPWNENSTYIQALSTEFSDLFINQNLESIDIKNAGILALFGDSIRSDYISPLGNISLYSASAKYLENKGVKSFEYGTFKNRSSNSEIMMRSMFDNSEIKNQMVSKEGGFTIDYRNSEIVPIFDKALRFAKINRPLVIFAGENYGIGESKEWASKGIRLLGIKAIIAKSFDDEYKSDLIAFGVLPLEFIDDDIESLMLKGNEIISLKADEIKFDSKVSATIYKEDIEIEIKLKSRLDTKKDVEVYKSGGIYPLLLKSITE